jgi:hypothetical protein
MSPEAAVNARPHHFILAMSKRLKATTAAANLAPPAAAAAAAAAGAPPSALAAAAAPPVVGLDCGVCFERYNDAARAPLMLTCGHTYCAACLTSLIKGAGAAGGGGKITCPSGDGVVISVPGVDVTSFPKNWLTVAQVAAAIAALPAAGQARCEVCEDLHAATFRCLDCQQHMCEMATKFHRRQSMTMSHRVVTQAELRSDPTLAEAKAAVVQLCKNHGQPLALFDMKCRLQLCPSCVDDHAGHLVVSLAKAAKACRSELGDWSVRLDTWATRADLSTTLVEKRMTEVLQSHDEEADKIRTAYNQVRLRFLSFQCVIAFIPLGCYLTRVDAGSGSPHFSTRRSSFATG